jgi:hypothetical protein
MWGAVFHCMRNFFFCCNSVLLLTEKANSPLKLIVFQIHGSVSLDVARGAPCYVWQDKRSQIQFPHLHVLVAQEKQK